MQFEQLGQSCCYNCRMVNTDTFSLLFPQKWLQSCNNDEDGLADFSRPSNVVKWKINAAQYFHCIILAYISFAFTFILPTFICRDKYFCLVFIFLYINEIIFYVFITFLYISICLFILSMFIILSDCICIT